MYGAINPAINMLYCSVNRPRPFDISNDIKTQSNIYHKFRRFKELEDRVIGFATRTKSK